MLQLNFQEVAPGEASGLLHLREYWGEEGWRRWTGQAICMDFGEGFDGEPAVAFVVQIEKISGPGPGEVGQYAKAWGSDGGTPAWAGDQAGLIVWPPVDDQPECGYELPWAYWPLGAGNLQIHNYP